MSGIGNFGMYSMGQVVNAFARFLLMPYYSRILSVDDFGKIGITWAVVSVLAVLSSFAGVLILCVKYYKVDSDIRAKIINFILALSFFLFILMGFSEYIFFESLEAALQLGIGRMEYWEILSIAYTGFLIEFFLIIYRNDFHPKKYVAYNFLFTIISMGAIVFYLTMINHGFIGFLHGYFIGNMVMSLVLGISYVKEHSLISGFVDRALMKDVLKIGFTGVVSILLTITVNNVGRFLLADLTNSFSNVGIYTMGTKIGDQFNALFIASFMTSIQPILLNGFSQSEKIFKMKIIQFFNAYVLCSGILFLLLNAFNVILFSVFIDSKYLESIPVVNLTICSYFFWGLAQILAITILCKEKLYVNSYFALVTGIVAVLANYFFVPLLGVLGAALGSLVTYMLMFVVYYVYCKQLCCVDYEIRKTGLFLIGVLICYGIQYVCDLLTTHIFVAFIEKLLVVGAFTWYVYKKKVYSEFCAVLSRLGISKKGGCGA